LFDPLGQGGDLFVYFLQHLRAGLVVAGHLRPLDLKRSDPLVDGLQDRIADTYLFLLDKIRHLVRTLQQSQSLSLKFGHVGVVLDNFRVEGGELF